MATATMEAPPDLIEADGGAAIPTPGSCTTLSGWTIKFSDDCSLADHVGDVFDRRGDYDLDARGTKRNVRVHWNHGLSIGGKPRRREVVGRADLTMKAAGVWADITLSPSLDSQFKRQVCDAARAGEMFLSSGSAAHLVHRADQAAGRCRSITAWPILGSGNDSVRNGPSPSQLLHNGPSARATSGVGRRPSV